MTDPHRDFSCSTSSSINRKDILFKNIDFDSSLESYYNVFNKAQQNFTTSSEISFLNLDNEQFDDNHRTFIKDKPTTIINAFTGKPISPNPWRKLCSKNIEPHSIVPIQVHSSHLEDKQSNQDKELKSPTPQGQLIDRTITRRTQRDTINNERSMDNTNDQAFEQSFQEHHQNTPLQRRRKKRNSLKDVIDNASSSSDENIKEHPSDLHLKLNRSIVNEASWYRLADVYTSEESDENNFLSRSNISYSIRLKSDIFTLDQSSTSISSVKDDPIISYDFLQSLSERVLIENKHSDAKPYFLEAGFQLKQKREELANKLLLIFNQDVFSSQLSDKVSVVWSGRLTSTAGHCTTRRNTRTAVITLSNKVCDSPERCRDTLLHEMCHAAVTLIDDVVELGHGPLWKKWTSIAERIYPCLPSISVRHTYDVIYKFIYRCLKCQYQVYRHSKSLNLAVDFCGKCMGQFELIINNNKDEVRQERPTPKKTINKYNLYVKENFQIMKQANPHLSTPQLMKQLSQQYKRKNQQQQLDDLPDLDQLKI